jgi:hypothetical protein
MKALPLAALMLGSICSPAADQAAPAKAATEGVTWAVDPKAWDGWKADVVKLRAARKEQPMAGTLYSEEVKWKGYHDVNASFLADGRVLNLDLRGFGWQKINQWPKGKQLVLCYEVGRGATLFDPETQTHLPVRHMVDKQGNPLHPIDAYVRSLDASSTYDMIAASHEASHLWKVEIDRSVREVLGLKHLPADVRKKFIELTEVRLRYCDLQGSFGGSAINADITGTASGPMVGEYYHALYRDAYFALSRLADTYQAFDRPPEK